MNPFLSLDDHVICYADGWGNVRRIYDSAKVIIRAWILSTDDVVHRQSVPYTLGDVIPGGVSGSCLLDPDNHIVLVEVLKNINNNDFIGSIKAVLRIIYLILNM